MDQHPFFSETPGHFFSKLQKLQNSTVDSLSSLKKSESIAWPTIVLFYIFQFWRQLAPSHALGKRSGVLASTVGTTTPREGERTELQAVSFRRFVVRVSQNNIPDWSRRPWWSGEAQESFASLLLPCSIHRTFVSCHKIICSQEEITGPVARRTSSFQ